MEYNFWFYTLSAIPQTLATIIALVATFMVFKLSVINSHIDTDVFHIKIFLPALDKEFDPYIERKEVEEILNSLEIELNKLDVNKTNLGLGNIEFRNLQGACKDIIKYGLSGFPLDASNLYKFIKYKYNSLLNNIKSRKKLINYLRDCFILATTTIVFSIIFLPMYVYSDNFSFLVIAVLVALSVVSVVYISYAVFKISEIK